MNWVVSSARSAMFALATLLVLGVVGSSQAAPRMYTGSLIIVSFGNDTSTGSTAPFATASGLGIPLAGNCNTAPVHNVETITFPSYPTSGSSLGTFMFTVPQYGGAVKTVDINGDGVADIVPGCGTASLLLGDPLTGGGTMQTTPGAGFIVPKSALTNVGGGASVGGHGAYLFAVHYGELANDGSTGAQGVFYPGGGQGDFEINRGTPAAMAQAKVSGGSKFGGVMQLLGTYFSNEGYLYNGTVLSVAKYTWLFQYVGDGDTSVTDFGVVITGNKITESNFGYTLTSGYPFTSYVYQEVFRWTTGEVRVTGGKGSFQTILERKGFDYRTANGRGKIQVITPMLTRWVGRDEHTSAAIGIMTITFAPEPDQWLVLGAGILMLGLLFQSTRKN